jgi:hypothetical protein
MRVRRVHNLEFFRHLTPTVCPQSYGVRNCLIEGVLRRKARAHAVSFLGQARLLIGLSLRGNGNRTVPSVFPWREYVGFRARAPVEAFLPALSLAQRIILFFGVFQGPAVTLLLPGPQFGTACRTQWESVASYLHSSSQAPAVLWSALSSSPRPLEAHHIGADSCCCALYESNMTYRTALADVKDVTAFCFPSKWLRSHCSSLAHFDALYCFKRVAPVCWMDAGMMLAARIP